MFGDVIIIDPKKLGIDFKDITAFKLISFLLDNDEDDGWEWSSSEEEYKAIKVNLGIMHMSPSWIVLDFDKEEIKLVTFKVTITDVERKPIAISIKKVGPKT